MTLAAVLQQQRAVDALRSALKSGAVHHAYLFAGPDGVGKELTAVGFTQALACPEKPKEGCGECSTCLRIERRSHPDVVWVMSQEEMISRGLAARSEFTNAPSREIRVEQIRALQERLAFRALEDGCKVALVVSADQMNVQAQNAFLKTLEEPAANTVLILIASSPDKLLATIRSRCAKIQFGALPTDFVVERLRTERSLDAATARLTAVMSEGSLSKALAMDVDSVARRKEVIAIFEAAARQEPSALLQFGETFGASRELAEAALSIIRVWLRDLLAIRAGSARLNYADLEEAAQRSSAKHTVGALHHRYNLLEQAAIAIGERNGAPRLQLERMVIEMGRRR